MANDTQDKRELRVFLSSTFRDMQVERDYLIKQVFPEIRKVCRERLVEFTEIDLRWGVTKEEAEQGKVIRICLEEIDRCRPYFMSFLGERYGWSPVDSDIEYKRELIDQFPVVEESLRAHKSVTEMEILHGVLNNPTMVDHSFFYFRAPELTQSLSQKPGSLADYLEDDAAGITKLIQLKDRIRASGLSLHENYPHVEALGERIKQDLLNVLDKRYPKDKVPTPLEAARLEHEAYAEDRCKAYIPNPADSEALDQYIQSRQDKPLIISGESGLGKSALLAYWLTQFRKQNQNLFIIQHYAGISGDANAIAILRRIMAEIKERTQDAKELPIKPEDVIKDFPLWLAKVRQSDPMLLILDGLNQIEAQHLNWLPSFWPANVRLIVSTLPDDSLTELQSRGWNTWLVQPMDGARRNQFIKTYLQSYRKALSIEQTSKIAGASQCGNPLFLRTVLEELRTFGVFEQLDTLIADYLQTNSPAELFVKVLTRMERDYGGITVSSVMCVLLASRRGLSETELMGITGISRLDISTFLLALDYHLARRGGLLNFFHDYLRQAVKDRYMTETQTVIATHLRLADHFEKNPEINDRALEELPWQLMHGQALERLKRLLMTIPTFNALLERRQYDLLIYWQRLTPHYDLRSELQGALSFYLTSPAPDKEDLLERFTEFSYTAGDLKLEKYMLVAWNKHNRKTEKNQCKLFQFKARYQHRVGKERQAIKYAESAEILAPDIASKFACSLDLMMLLSFGGRHQKAFLKVKQIESNFQEFMADNELKKAYFQHMSSFPYHDLDFNLEFSQRNAEAKQLYIRYGLNYDICIARVNEGDGHWGSGSVATAIHELEKSYQEASEWNIPHALNIAAICLANVHASMGNYDKAMPLYKEGLQISEQIGHTWDYLYGKIYFYLAESELKQEPKIDELIELSEKARASSYNYLYHLAMSHIAISTFLVNNSASHRIMDVGFYNKLTMSRIPSTRSYALAALIQQDELAVRSPKKTLLATRLIETVSKMQGVKGRPGVLLKSLAVLNTAGLLSSGDEKLLCDWRNNYYAPEFRDADSQRFGCTFY